MLLDDVTIKVIAGHGGDGEVAFSRTKMVKGPTGGNGGHGGNIYLEGTGNIGALYQFRFKKTIKAQKGGHGKGYSCDGTDGEDIILLVPTGTHVKNLDNNKEVDIIKIGQREMVARGGRGGKGNFLFRGSTNTTPLNAEPGRPGQEYTLRLQLKMIADIGFVGLPNVGKSSLLNEISNANSKVANYPFTTLEAHLGVYKDLIIADIPGIIEGASEGKGLGIRFLKHVERTKDIIHFISAESNSPVSDYKTIRKEMGKYNKELLEKKEYIFISKHDLTDKKKLDSIVKKLKKYSDTVIPISIYDYDSILEVNKLLDKLNKQKSAN